MLLFRGWPIELGMLHSMVAQLLYVCHWEMTRFMDFIVFQSKIDSKFSTQFVLQ